MIDFRRSQWQDAAASLRLVWILGAAIAFSWITPMPAEAVPAKARVFWSGSSEGFQVQWSSADLKVVDAQGAITFSAQKLAKENFDRLTKTNGKRIAYEEN